MRELEDLKLPIVVCPPADALDSGLDDRCGHCAVCAGPIWVRRDVPAIGGARVCLLCFLKYGDPTTPVLVAVV